MIQQEGTVAPTPSGSGPDPVPTISARLRWWATAIGMVLAGFGTFALAANIALDAMTATENPRWPVYLMMALVVSMLWSGASLLRKKSNQGIFVFVLSVAFGLPLVALVLAVSFGD
jgi:FtsH-binding integral membrane protein